MGLSMFITNLWDNPQYFFFWSVAIVFSICIHELAHVYAAVSQGDDTAARSGYVTLNPMVLMGGHALFALALMGISWGRVPVNHRRFRHHWSAAFVSAVGPGSNLVLALLFIVLSKLDWTFMAGSSAPMFAGFFSIACGANCILTVLNLLPVPMFDGWEVWSMALPRMRRVSPQKRQQIGWIVLLILFLTPASGIIWMGASRLQDVLNGLTGFMG